LLIAAASFEIAFVAIAVAFVASPADLASASFVELLLQQLHLPVADIAVAFVAIAVALLCHRTVLTAASFVIAVALCSFI
jgi:hypothetical protein